LNDLRSTTPLPDQSASTPRQPYVAPRVQPLGEWSALTLVTSLPIGPGGQVFGGQHQP